MKRLPKVAKVAFVQRKPEQRSKAAYTSKAESVDAEENRDVFAGKTERDVSRRKILDDLARAEYAEGIYGRVPDDFQAGR